LRDGGTLGAVVRHHQLHRLRDVREPLLHLRCTEPSSSCLFVNCMVPNAWADTSNQTSAP
jgi:hypothetical protein